MTDLLIYHNESGISVTDIDDLEEIDIEEWYKNKVKTHGDDNSAVNCYHVWNWKLEWYAEEIWYPEEGEAWE